MTDKAGSWADTFNGPLDLAGRWARDITWGGTSLEQEAAVTTSGGELILSHPDDLAISSYARSGAISGNMGPVASYDLTNSAVYIEVTHFDDIPNDMTGTFAANTFSVTSAALVVQQLDGTEDGTLVIGLQRGSGDSGTQIAVVYDRDDPTFMETTPFKTAWDPDAHRWWRLGHDGTNFFADTSADGVSWTNQWSDAAPDSWNPTDVSVEISFTRLCDVSTYGNPVGTHAEFRVNNFNTLGNAPSASVLFFS